MNLNYFLVEKNISAYRLAKEANIPYTTIFDILHHKCDLLDCSCRTVMKIAKVLHVRMEDLLEEDEFMDFDLFKSQICHNLKRMGDKPFIVDTYKKKEITYYYNKKRYRESFYLLAMVDYLSKRNNIPLAKEFNDIRKHKLERIVYPKSVLAMYAALNDEKILEDAKKNAIPEFLKYNIVEAEIENVI